MNSRTSDPVDLSGVKLVLRTLQSKNYRLFFTGQSISLIGTWIQQIAVGWLVYRLTNSALMLGIVGFASQIPTFLLTPFGGVLADKWNRHRILVVTQTLSLIQAMTLSILVLTGTIAIWQIILLSTLMGCINSFDIPARQSFIIDMIEKKEDLGNAIALNSTMVNGARLLGPSIAGLMIATVGEGICFLTNGLSYIGVILALFAMKIPPRKIEEGNIKAIERLREGFSYAFGFPPIRSILFFMALVSFMGMPYSVLMPVFAREVLHGGSHTLGFLMGASGMGALTGALYLASRKNVRGLGIIIVLAASAFGTGLITFSLSRILGLSYLFMFLTGFGMMVQMASSNIILQTIVDDDKRGRVMSFYTMAFMGMTPFGSLFAGSLAGKIGAPNTLMIGGIFCILGAINFARKLPSWRKMIRPIYLKKGIIPEVASGIDTASTLTLPPED